MYLPNLRFLPGLFLTINSFVERFFYSSQSISIHCCWTTLRIFTLSRFNSNQSLLDLRQTASLLLHHNSTCLSIQIKTNTHHPTVILSIKMGQNVSSNYAKDTFKNSAVDVIGAADAVNEKILLILWICALYGIAMIASTALLCDRWGGPHGGRKVGFGSVLASLLLSTAWPLVFLYLIFN